MDHIVVTKKIQKANILATIYKQITLFVKNSYNNLPILNNIKNVNVLFNKIQRLQKINDRIK